jgi:hypothetical protein
VDPLRFFTDEGLTGEEARRLAPERPVLVAYRGSHSHGTYVKPTDPNGVDDIDIITAYIPSVRYYFGTEGQKWKGRDVKVGQWDGAAYEFRHFVSLLEHCNPNVISALWLREQDYIYLSPEGQALVDNREMFSSKLAAKSFAGYAYSQLKRMTAFRKGDRADLSPCSCSGEFHEAGCDLAKDRGRGSSKLYATGFMGAKRKALVEKYGYDAKNASHLIRLLRMGTEFVATGRLQVYRPDAAELIDIKSGRWSLERVEAEAQSCFEMFRQAEAVSKLPEKPDFKAINDMVVRLLCRNHLDEVTELAT